jgi:hypothetical protein
VVSPPVPLRWVLIRDPLGQFATQDRLCTDGAAEPAQMIACFLQRWQIEVTFEESRRHLRIETQRQWSDLAIRRTTPVLFSLVTLLVQQHHGDTALPVRQAAWYRKDQPTYADAFALIRRDPWQHQAFSASAEEIERVEVLRALLERLTDTLAYVA